MRPVSAAWLALLVLGCGGGGGSPVDEPDHVDASVEGSKVDAGKPADATVTKNPQADAGKAGTFTEIYTQLFPATTNARCSFCHSMRASDVSNGLLAVGMTQDTAYEALVGKTSTSSKCGGMELVVPGEPEASLFFLKFSETPPCGGRMPNGGAGVSAAQLEQVRSWIAAGAKND